MGWKIFQQNCRIAKLIQRLYRLVPMLHKSTFWLDTYTYTYLPIVLKTILLLSALNNNLYIVYRKSKRWWKRLVLQLLARYTCNNFPIPPVLPISVTVIAKQPPPSYLLPSSIRPPLFLWIEIRPVNFPLDMHYTTTTVTGIP